MCVRKHFVRVKNKLAYRGADTIVNPLLSSRTPSLRPFLGGLKGLQRAFGQFWRSFRSHFSHPVRQMLGDKDVSRSLLAIRCQDKTGIQMYNAHSLYRLIGRWICLQINWVDPLLDLPCNSLSFLFFLFEFSSTFLPIKHSKSAAKPNLPLLV